MSMTADDLIGKTLYAKNSDVPVLSSISNNTVSRTVPGGLAIGIVQTWIQQSGKLYFGFDSASSQFYDWVEYVPSRLSIDEAEFVEQTQSPDFIDQLNDFFDPNVSDGFGFDDITTTIKWLVVGGIALKVLNLID